MEFFPKYFKGLMKIRDQIQKMFDGKAFERPLFYCHEGGLRFELSEGGHFINQFLTAHRKALEICNGIFQAGEMVQVCIKFFGGKSLLSELSIVKALKVAGIFPDTPKEHWTEFDPEWEGDEDYKNIFWHFIAFKMPHSALTNLLWCALATDFGNIEPNPKVMVYLFNFERKIMVWPYDDRGMDVVGKNTAILSNLYSIFNHYLLDYDRKIMDETFKHGL